MFHVQVLDFGLGLGLEGQVLGLANCGLDSKSDIFNVGLQFFFLA